MKLFERMGKKIKERFEKMAEENQKLYGGQKLDCCTINKRKPVKATSTERPLQQAHK